MSDMSIIKKSTGFTLIELMVVIAIIALLTAIAIPNYIGFRNKGYCSEAESNANLTGAAIADYFGVGTRNELPTIEDLKLKIKFANPADIQGDPNTTISILVTDRTGRCPKDYQDAHEYWSNDVFTKYVR
jgi:type IV pilus assembly protein PilA